ncbi:LysM domain-containing protein [Clostridium hydrogenum]|uniref:LysM domain-containing protein n=1 Tax=Clostridium hydrogenum TaxID=2855764 RepID=UPI001F2F5512|nr:LysM domain-containing protein [Clostridium hydrogenum]
MSKNKLMVILSCVVLVFIVSYGVYYDQSQKHKVSKQVSQSQSTLQKSNTSAQAQQSSNNNIASNDKTTNVVNNSTIKTSDNSNNSINSYEIVKTVSEDSDYVYIKYRLKNGDHLWSLAEHFMPTYKTSGVVKEIEKQNTLENDDNITKDSSLIIPAEKNVLVNTH